ncbi:conserved hypothetical protein [Vibrio cholerae O1 str. 2010EL-1786]|uniref:Uncharacterized protein n=2 Tax=Vibrio cholerae TaxID=666 RepID=Q9KSR4_VIBCH|nr:hypothetical protein VC_1192 [Vibrio cholerae O1 biovar El Tor str. N16961]ACP05464.1 conserved hypothetical protein [Vibrio cholerae M66-2]ACP09319.1 conserved hypothetical protein [Vibrio cholerae O395]AET26304.1 conserved hypothetical protein [Vibrio cholerae O1 str. 2010EL-1786]
MVVFATGFWIKKAQKFTLLHDDFFIYLICINFISC